MSNTEENNGNPILTLRNARDIIVIALIAVATWKLLSSEISVSIKEFTFTDLLSIFVSFFAIGLSIAFYFKATDTSNKFYDNSYKFTKEISEILGRIEAGFGEKLKHIDEGYAGIRDRFDQLPFDANKAREEIAAEKIEIEKKKKEQNAILESLANRAKLAETEKEELFRQMEKANSELEAAKNDLRSTQLNIAKHQISSIDPDIRRRAINYLVEKISDELPSGPKETIPLRMIREVFTNIKDGFHPEALDDLLSIGFIDEEGELTRQGIENLRFRFRKSA